MRCRFCGSMLQPVHGHGACLNNQCPMFGLNQDECCNGEATAPGCPVTGDEPTRVPGASPEQVERAVGEGDDG